MAYIMPEKCLGFCQGSKPKAGIIRIDNRQKLLIGKKDRTCKEKMTIFEQCCNTYET